MKPPEPYVPTPIMGTQRRLNESLPTPVAASLYPASATSVGTSATVILDVPEGEYWEIKKITAFNTSGTSDSVSVFLAPSAAAAAASNRVGKSVAASLTSVDFPHVEGLVLGPTDRLLCQTDAQTMNVFCGVKRVFSAT